MVGNIKDQISKIKITYQRLKCFKNLTFYIVILLFTFYFLHFPNPVHAQDSTSSASSLPTTNYQLPTTVSPTSPLFTDLLVSNIFHTFSCLGVGQSVIGQPCLTYQLSRNAQGAIQSVPVLSQVDTSGGVLGTTTNLIGLLYTNRPVRSVDYLASVGKDLGIVKEANAQVVGSGAAVLNPILKLWEVSRNISYIAMIIIFLIIGLMVMFRQRINPQTVITAQAALPGLVLGLILITFSYFLAGLISDMAFIGTNLVGYYFQAAQTGGDLNQNLTQVTANQNALTIFSRFVGILEQGDIQQIVSLVFDNVGGQVQTLLRFFAGIAAFQIGSQVGHVVPIVGDIASIITGFGATLLTAAATPFLLGQVFSWIAMAALIYAMLRLLLKLVNNYLTIIFLTITAPFQFLAASLPGRQEIATTWIMNLLANILAFPAVLAVFYFVAFLVGRPQEATTLFNITSPLSLGGSSTLPLLGGLNLSFLQSLLAFGALMATPAIPDVIVRTIGKVSQAGQLLGQEISSGFGGGQKYAGQFQQQGFGAISTIGQSYTHFRGEVPGYGPATAAGVETWQPLSRLGGRLGAWQPFGKKKN